MADQSHGQDAGGGSLGQAGIGSWQAPNGEWYPEEAHPGGGWSQAADGRWYPPGPGWQFFNGRWSPAPVELAPAVVAVLKRRANIRIAGWVVMGLAGFILFTGAFSSQNTGTTEDTSAFFVGCLIVAVIVGLIGAAMVWPLTTTSRALGLSPLESRRSVGNARRRRPTAPMVVTKPALDAAGDDEQSARPASPPASPQPTNEPVAIVAFLLGLLSFLLLPLGAVAVAAIACGLVALRRASRNGTSSGLALAGAVLGSLSLATVVFLLATGLYDDVVVG